MTKFRNPFRATIDYLLGDDDQDLPALPQRLTGDLVPVISAHVRSLVEFQNTDYAALYLDRLGRFHHRHGIDEATFRQIADLLAARMSFNDPVRVAQIVLGRAPYGPPPDTLNLAGGLYRPEVQEVVAALPAGLARKLGNGLRRMRMLGGRFRIRTASVGGRFKLRLLVRLRRLRPMSLRYATEHSATERWLHMIDRALVKQPDAVKEIVNSISIVKGWGANYRLALQNWHYLIDHLAKPVFDGKCRLKNLPASLAIARISLTSDTTGEAMRAVVASARSAATTPADA